MEFSLDEFLCEETINDDFLKRFKSKIDLPLETKLFLLSLDLVYQKNTCIELEWKDALNFRKPADSIKNSDGSYKIRINLQYGASLHFLAHRIYSLPNQQIIGFGPNIEEPIEKITSLQANLIDLPLDFRKSKLIQKQIAAQQLATNMLEIVYMHEQAHITLEHYDYQNKFESKIKNSNIEEIQKDARYYLQALEAEADRQACLHLLRMMQERKKSYSESLSSYPELKPIYDHIYNSEYTIALWAAIAFGLVLSFPEVSWVDNKIEISKLRHPPNYVRLSLLLNSICDAAFLTLSGEEKQNASRSLKNSTFMYIIASIASITNQTDFFNIKNLSNKEHIDNCEEVYFRQQELINEMCNSDKDVRLTSTIFQT